MILVGLRRALLVVVCLLDLTFYDVVVWLRRGFFIHNRNEQNKRSVLMFDVL